MVVQLGKRLTRPRAQVRMRSPMSSSSVNAATASFSASHFACDTTKRRQCVNLQSLAIPLPPFLPMKQVQLEDSTMTMYVTTNTCKQFWLFDFPQSVKQEEVAPSCCTAQETAWVCSLRVDRLQAGDPPGGSAETGPALPAAQTAERTAGSPRPRPARRRPSCPWAWRVTPCWPAD